MKKLIPLLAVCFLWQIAAAAGFPDVAESNPYAPAVNLLGLLSIVSGDEAGFRPDDPVKRGEFCKIAYVIYTGSPDASAYAKTSRFADVSENAWYNGYINWAAENGIVSGMGDGRFAPEACVTLEQAIKMLIIAIAGEPRNPIWPGTYLQAAANTGLLSGLSYTDTSLPATREQIAQLGCNAIFEESVLLGGSPNFKYFGVSRPGQEGTVVNILDYSSYKSGDNWAGAFREAFKHAQVIYVPAGTYASTAINVPSGKTIRGAGEKTVFLPLQTTMFLISGDAGPEMKIAEDTADFSKTISIAGSGLKEGDLIYLLSQRNCLILEDAGADWCLGRSYASGPAIFYGEFLQVCTADNTRITVSSAPVFPAYLSSGKNESDPLPPTVSTVTDWPYRRNSTTIQRITPAENVLLKDFVIEANRGNVIHLKWARGCAVDGVTVRTSESEPAEKYLRAVLIQNCLDCEIRNSSCIIRGGIVFDEASVSYTEYSVYNVFFVAGSQNCGFLNCHSNLSTHGFFINGTNKGGVSLRCYIINCRAENAKWSGIYVAQATYDTRIIENTITGCMQGIKIGGRKCYIADNYIDVGVAPKTDYFYLREAEGGTAGIAFIEGYALDSTAENNTIKNCVSGILVRDGYEKTNIFTHGWIELKHNVFMNCMRAYCRWKNGSNISQDYFKIIQ